MAQYCLTEVSLLLLALLVLLVNSEARQKEVKELRRARREWILPPAKLMENTDYTHLEFIAKIRSDKDKVEKVEYFLSGKGADKEPFNLFVVDRTTGFVRVTDKLDRENCPYYNLTGIARYRNGTTAESNIPLTVTVLDQNDNAPTLELHTGNITEASKKGTFVMQLKGEDKDQAGTMNAKISYKIVSQEPEGTNHMFYLNESTGKLYVKNPTLDRETCDFYKLVIKVTDLGGAAGGLTGTGSVEIKILDINDNIPTLEKSEDCDTDESWAQVSVEVLTAVRENVQLTPNQLHLQPVSTAIIVEGCIVLNDLQNLPEALRLLFGLSYALHLNYPKAMKNTFGFIQKAMLGLGEKTATETAVLKISF